jgi:hypothetical protein
LIWALRRFCPARCTSVLEEHTVCIVRLSAYTDDDDDDDDDDGARLPGCTVSSDKTSLRFVGSTARHGVPASGNRSVFYLLVNKAMLQIV